MGSVHMTSDLCTKHNSLVPYLTFRKLQQIAWIMKLLFAYFILTFAGLCAGLKCWNCDENCDENVHFCHRLKDDDGLSLSCAYDPPLTKQCSVVEDRFIQCYCDHDMCNSGHVVHISFWHVTFAAITTLSMWALL